MMLVVETPFVIYSEKTGVLLVNVGADWWRRGGVRRVD